MKDYLLILVVACLLVACSSSSDALASTAGDAKSDKSSIVLSEKAQSYLNSSRVTSSNVAVVESGNETIEEMKRLLSDKYDVRVLHSDEGEILFKKDSVHVDLSELESDRNR